MSFDRPIAEDDLQAFVDGRLDPARTAVVAAYLAADPEAAQRVAKQKAMRGELRAAFAPYAAEPVPPALNLAHLIAARRQPRVIAWGSIAACLCFLAIGGGGGWVMRGAAEPPVSGLGALAREASDGYRTFATDRIQPVEFRAADQARLGDWVADRLHHPVPVPDLAKSGYRFMGGRVVATPHGPAALYMYDDDKGTRLVLLARPMEDAAAGPMVEHKSPVTDGFSWAADGLGFSLVGPDQTTGLHPLADEARRQLNAAI